MDDAKNETMARVREPVVPSADLRQKRRYNAVLAVQEQPSVVEFDVSSITFLQVLFLATGHGNLGPKMSFYFKGKQKLRVDRRKDSGSAYLVRHCSFKNSDNPRLHGGIELFGTTSGVSRTKRWSV